MVVDEVIGSCLLYCFKHNKDYAAYARARAVGNEPVYTNLEKQYEKIKDIHADIGELEWVSDEINTKSFRKWADQRHHLVNNFNHYWFVENLSTHFFRPGNLLLTIPLQESRAKTLEEVTKLIDLAYRFRDNVDKYTSVSENMKTMLKPLEQPKYELTGNEATKSRIVKAVYVHKLRGGGPDYKLSQSDAVLAALQDNKNPFDWTMTEQDNTDHERGVLKKSLPFKSKVKLLQRAETDFAALCKNIITSRFPDFD